MLPSTNDSHQHPHRGCNLQSYTITSSRNTASALWSPSSTPLPQSISLLSLHLLHFCHNNVSNPFFFSGNRSMSLCSAHPLNRPPSRPLARQEEKRRKNPWIYFRGAGGRGRQHARTNQRRWGPCWNRERHGRWFRSVCVCIMSLRVKFVSTFLEGLWTI